MCACDKVTWTREAYSSYYMKGLHEDQVLGYDAQIIIDAFVYLKFCLRGM